MNGEEQKLARIHVRTETSKVRTSHTFLCRNGQYFELLREISKPKSADKLIFTLDTANELSKHTLLYHFDKMIELAAIAGRKVRDLVPHSLRHFMITQHIMSGLTFRQIAERCEMKSYDELKAEMEAIQQQMVEAKKNERANALKKVKRLCKEFGFTAGMLKVCWLKGGRSHEKSC